MYEYFKCNLSQFIDNMITEGDGIHLFAEAPFVLSVKHLKQQDIKHQSESVHAE